MRKSAVLPLVAVLAACSSAKHASIAPTIASPSSVAAPGPDACALVTKADVDGVLRGLTIVAGEPARQPQESDCLYLVSGTSRAVDIRVFTPDGAARFERLLTSLPGTVKIAGLGDRALSQRDGSTLASIMGNTLVEVVAENDDSELFRKAVRHLLEVALSRLPASGH